MMYDNIPIELQELPQWVCWQLVERGGKPTKIPINPHTGAAASSTNPETWGTFGCVTKLADRFSGIGFVFTANDPYCGIDMDGHIDGELVGYIHSYTERSQSGKGAHIICRAKLPDEGRRNDKYEIYDRGRYFVMTGDVIGQHAEIADAQTKVDVFVDHVFGPAKPKSKPQPKRAKKLPSKTDVIDRIMASQQADKFKQLWSGDISGWGSHSEADAALLSILRFWTGGDKQQSLALFGQSKLAERDKWAREDYQERTWQNIDYGEVYNDLSESILTQNVSLELPSIIRKCDLAPWRKVSAREIEQIVSDTLLGDMIDILRSPTNPPLPFEIGFAKALPIFGALLSGENEDMSPSVRAINRGIDRARVKINTSGGQSCNIWTILVAPSASGKDIGGLSDDLLKREGLFLGTAGSEEGVADALINRGNGVMLISEMANWLDQRHWQHKATSFLTYAWNKGHFAHTMSKRGKDAPAERCSDYCFPSILANVQKSTLQRLASRSDLENGFLGRFVIIEHDNPDWFPFPSSSLDRYHALSELQGIADTIKRVSGTISPPLEQYQRRLVEDFINYRADLKPVYRRLCNEYLLRIALMLSIDRTGGIPPVFSDKSISDAETICKWLYTHAERTLGHITEDTQSNIREMVMERLMSVIKSHGANDVSLRIISQYCGRGTTAKERRDLLAELVDRGELSVKKEGKSMFFSIS